MALSRGNATRCSVSGSYGKTWSAHQPTGFRRQTGDQTFNACGRWRNTHYTKKTNKNWYQTLVRTLARATEMNKHLRLTAAVVCSTTCCEKSVKNTFSSSWYGQLIFFFLIAASFLCPLTQFPATHLLLSSGCCTYVCSQIGKQVHTIPVQPELAPKIWIFEILRLKSFCWLSSTANDLCTQFPNCELWIKSRKQYHKMSQL